jgi:hypothetical protein
MENYTVDASVYALPEISDTASEDEKISLYSKYLEEVSILTELLKVRYVRMYLFSPDIDALQEMNLYFNSKAVREMINLGIKPKSKKPIDVIQADFSKLIDDLQKGECFGDRLLLYKIYTEENLGIRPDITLHIKNKALANNLKNHLCALAMLNGSVYRNDAAINKIVTKSPEPEINIMAVVKKARHNILGLKKENIRVNEQNVRNCTIDGITKKSILSINELLSSIKSGRFASLVFGSEVEGSLHDYEKQVQRGLTDRPDKYEIIEKHIDEYPNTIYSYLETLNRSVKYFNSDPSKYQSDDCRLCNLYLTCQGFIRFCGCHCSDETKRVMSDKHAIADRTRENGKGKQETEIFHLHLRPYYFDDHMEHWRSCFLTLRIYFSYSDGKITVGWIGRHLYLPRS